MSLRVAIAGATGAVGQEFLSLMAERGFPVGTLRLLASERSVGRKIPFGGEEIAVELLSGFDFSQVDVAFFSAGSHLKDEARRAAAEGACVIDNSSAFRRDPDVPLVVPQINGRAALGHAGLIANPNCSTILLVMALGPLHQQVPVRRIVVSTYQAVSGSGAAGLGELSAQAEAERTGEPLVSSCYPKPIHGNVLPFVQAFDEGDLTTEEWKMVHETRRILEHPDLAVSTTCVRVPVRRAHSEAVNIEFERAVAPDEVRSWLQEASGVQVVDDPATGRFPTPRDADGGDDVLVGRIRRDPGHERAIDLWLTGDQLRKGAALNAVEIAEYLIQHEAIRPTSGSA